MFNVTTYGAVGNGTFDDRPAIQSAINAAESAGGGIVYFPKGVYSLGSSVPVTLQASPLVTTPVCLVISSDNITLKGDGEGVTILKLADSCEAQMVGFGGCRNCSIQSMELDGNLANHAFPDKWINLYSFGDLTNFLARDLWLHHASGYGMGLQHGDLTDVSIDNVLIEDTGQDGFDNKNSNGADKYNRMSGVTVRRAGLNTALSGQSCIDLRGVWTLSNIHCVDFNHTSARCKTGVRFRPNNQEDGAVGSNLSSLTNFYVKPSSVGGTIGVEMNGYQCSVTNGVVETCEAGVLSNNVENTVGNVVAKGCTDGFVADNATGQSGDRAVFSGCVAKSGTSGFKIFTSKCVLMGIQAISNTHGVNLRNGSSNTVISGVASSNSGSNLNKESAGLTWTNAGFVY